MRKFRCVLSCLLMLCLIASVSFVTLDAKAATNDYEEVAANGIVIHYKDDSGSVPSIYYWNSLPENIEVDYPGETMNAEGSGWYTYSFPNVTKINMQFIVNGEQSKELTRSSAGEYWYKNGKWYNGNPELIDTYERTDMRKETIYFIITTRFYDGDTGNNVHCWDDTQANNPDSDPAWRGDFKGLIEKLDYIKALGFSAIWITPVVENMSSYDYHGYHASNFAKIDPRYESDGVSFQDVIDAAHEKDMKIVQDVVWNHTCNFGENFLAPMFTRDENSVQDWGTFDCVKKIEGSALDRAFPNYDSLPGSAQYNARIAAMKEDSNDTNNYYHHDK
ncbi:MAG: starch-binding protein, partial [Lachnospiraceae bacterium]|nr:starch-binding protein [Lachnospiraceae bacterium]